MNLAEEVFLVNWDGDKQKLTSARQHPYMVRAAVLVELWADRALSDDPRFATPTGRPAGSAPGRAALLNQIGESRPHRWKRWVSRGAKDTYATVREDLATSRVISTRPRRFLGLQMQPRVTVNDPRAVGELVSKCRRAVFEPGDVPLQTAALVAIVAAAEVNTVFSGKERRRQRHRIAQLAAQAGPAAPALRRVIVASQGDAGGAA